MTSFLLDANAISAIASAPDGPVARCYEANLGECCTSIIVASEVRYGIAKAPERRGSKRAAALLELLPIRSYEAPADHHYAGLRAALERAGTPIGANDLFIAAHALALDCTLVTDNEREFRRVSGLRVENWLR